MTFNFYLLLIALSVFGGMLFFFRKKSPVKKTEILMLSCLVLIFIFELIGKYLITLPLNQQLLNNLGWNYVVPTLLTAYFYCLTQDSKGRKNIFGGYLALLTFTLLNSLWLQPMQMGFQYFSFLASWTFVLLLAAKQLLDIINLKVFSDKNLLSIPHFWVIISILFFFIESNLVNAVIYFHPSTERQLLQAYLNLNYFLAGIMFLFFGFSFYAPVFFSKKLELS